MSSGSWETSADSWIRESARSESVNGNAGPALAAHAGAGGARLGWDPYDVWLQRIRLPREQKLLDAE